MPIPRHVEDLTTPALPGGRAVDHRDQPGTQDGALLIRPDHPWVFVHYADDPGGWVTATIEGDPQEDPDAGTWWLPVLIKLPSKPGLCGHRTKKRGQSESHTYGRAHQRVRDRGGVVIPPSLGYCVAHTATHPITKVDGHVHLDPWSRPLRKIRGRRQRFEFDRQRYLRWLLFLVRQGHVPQPDPQIVDHHRARVASRLERRDAVDYSGDERKRTAHRAPVVEQAETLEDAEIPETGRVVDPEPRVRRKTYRQVQIEAKALGYRVGGVSRADLEDMIASGPAEPEGA